jgi:hypothetical protein
LDVEPVLQNEEVANNRQTDKKPIEEELADEVGEENIESDEENIPKIP